MITRILIILAALSGTANAETLTCPVGGERFAAPEVPACLETGGQTMIFSYIGCLPDPMPQCPQNFLPMYKVFTTEELALLEPYMQSESYESNVDSSPYYLAYIIEKYLNGPDKQLAGLLLLWGLWQAPSLITEDPEFIAALSSEIAPNLLPSSPDDNALLLGLAAFVNLLAGQEELAQSYFEQAESQNGRAPDVKAYLAAVRACFEDRNAAHCSANALIPLP